MRAGWSEDAEQTRRAWRDGALAGSGRAGASQVLVPAAHASILSGVRGGPTSRCLLPSGEGISCQRFSFRPCSPDSRARGKTFRRFDKNNSPSFFFLSAHDTVEPWLGRCSAARLPGSSPKSSLGRRRSALAFSISCETTLAALSGCTCSDRPLGHLRGEGGVVSVDGIRASSLRAVSAVTGLPARGWNWVSVRPFVTSDDLRRPKLVCDFSWFGWVVSVCCGDKGLSAWVGCSIRSRVLCCQRVQQQRPRDVAACWNPRARYVLW